MIDVNFIEELEGNERRGYVPKVGTSGVTIGMGLDLGNFGDITALGLPSRIEDKLMPYVGYRRDVAEVVLEDNPLVISVADVNRLNIHVIDHILAKVARLFERDSMVSWWSLTVQQKTVVYSVLHQYGSPVRVPTFWGHVTKGNWDGVVAELRNFGDSFPTRRNKEADYLEN